MTSSALRRAVDEMEGAMEVALQDYVAGGALVTDLVNTVPGLRIADRLTSVEELAQFLDTHDIGHGTVRDLDVVDARRLRDELVDLFVPRAESEVVGAVSAILAACPHRLLAGPEHASAKHGDWRLTTAAHASTVDELRLVAGTALLAVIHALGTDRLRDCSSPHCVGMFVDTSNTGRRRFCIPRICGNRLNVARYRARKTGRSGREEPDA